MQVQKPFRMVVCLLTLPISGVLAIASLLMRRFIVFPGDNLVEWADVVTSSAYALGQYLYAVAYVLPFCGFWALYMILAESERVERVAFWGLMGSLIGTALALPTMGVFTFVSPVIGDLYKAGFDQLPQVIVDIGLGTSMVLGMPAAFLYAGGCLLLGIAAWRSGVLPRWTGVMLALHGFSLVFGFGVPLVLVVSWVLLVTPGAWLTYTVWRCNRSPNSTSR